MKLVKKIADEFTDRMWWFWHDIKDIPYNVRHGIVNLWKWRHIVWNDRDWDYAFIYDMLEFKIRKQMRYMKPRNRFESTKYDVERMELVLDLIKKVREEYYETEYFDYVENKYWFEKVEEKHDGQDLFEWKSETVSESLDDYFKLYPRKYNLYKSDNKTKTALNIAKHNSDQVHRILHRIIEQNILSWWD